MRFSVPRILLWLFVIVLGIEIGGGLYETLVVMPVWTQSPPDSVLAYYHHNVANQQFVLNQGGRFWVFFTPALGLISLATLLSGLKTPPEHRKWRIAATLLALLVVVSTFVWFIPNIIVLLGEGVTKLSGEQITQLTNQWVRLNWVRAAVYSAAWLAGLRAFGISTDQ